MAKTGSSNAYLHSKRNGLLNGALELMVGAQRTGAGEVEVTIDLFSLPGASEPPPQSPTLNRCPHLPQVAAPTHLSHGTVTTAPRPASDQELAAPRRACYMVAQNPGLARPFQYPPTICGE